MNARCVVGLDLSLASTGIAVIDADGRVRTELVRSAGHRDDTTAQRAQRLRTLSTNIVRRVPPGAEVIVEAPSFGSSGAGTWDRAGLWWLTVAMLVHRGHLVHQAPPATVKRWIAGSGKAEKNTIGLHVGRLFPALQATTDDELDAVALAHVAAVHAGLPVSTRAGHTPENWKAVKWAATTTERTTA